MRITRRRNRRVVRRSRSGRVWLLAVLVLLLGTLVLGLLWAWWAPARQPRGALTEAEQRGKALFLRGVSTSGNPLVGKLGPEGVELTGSVAACSRCHGPRGRGTGEGGVAAPNIQASRLFAPVFRSDSGAGQWERPAYDARSLSEAIRRGVTPGGRVLGPVMPRFELSEGEVADLVSYLHRLGADDDPGVSEDRLVLGTALPLSGKLAPVGEDVRAVLSAAFEEVNQQGGLFGRRLELRVEDDSLAVAGQDGTDRLMKAGVFALVGSVRSGPRESDARLETEALPLVAPVGLSDAHVEKGGQMIFYVYPGLELQARVAVQHLHGAWNRRRAEPVLAVIHPRGGSGEDWARGASREAGRRDWSPPKVLAYKPGRFDAAEASRWLEGSRAEALLFAGTDVELSALLAERGGAHGGIPIYAPGPLSPPAHTVTGWEQVRFVHASPPLEGFEPGLQEFEAFLRRHGLTPRNLAAQLNAYASARLLIEALRRSGADVSRAGLVSALESFQDVDTGVSWPVTFGSQGRVGVRGGFIVRMDEGSRDMTPLSDWIALSP